MPLKDRVLKSSNLSVSLVSLSRCPDTYKHWTDVQIDKALDAVRKKRFTVRRAAEEFGVPKSTLHDRISGRVQVGGHSGPSKYLSDEEEDELEEFLVGAAAVGYARSRQQVIQLVQDVTRKGLAVHVSHGWWDSFKRRHPKLTLRTASPLSYTWLVTQISFATTMTCLNALSQKMALWTNHLISSTLMRLVCHLIPLLLLWWQNVDRRIHQQWDQETKHRSLF